MDTALAEAQIVIVEKGEEAGPTSALLLGARLLG